MGSCQNKEEIKQSKREVEWKVVRDKENTKIVEAQEHIKLKEEDLMRSRIYRYLEQFDSNGDQELDIDEILLFLQKIASKNKNKREVTLKDARIFLEKADLNNDGKISKQEFYNYYKTT